MTGYKFSFTGAALVARGSGAVWWGEHQVLVVSDLHLGKSERIARLGGAMLPPFETRDTLARLNSEIMALDPTFVICLGDSFDDLAASAGLESDAYDCLLQMMAGRRWIWIEGNHDPGPVGIGGTHLAAYDIDAVTFRHIALPGASGEISGHYHPKAVIKAGGHSISRACFLWDRDRLILPAFGTYTGGLRSDVPELVQLMRPDALAVLTGPVCRVVPMPGRRFRGT